MRKRSKLQKKIQMSTNHQTKENVLNQIKEIENNLKISINIERNLREIRAIAYLLTWILGVASKQLRLLHGRVGDSTIVVNSLSPQMSELVEDAIAS